MSLIQTSGDLLNIVLAFCVLWFTIFVVWFIYYLAMMMRQAYKMTKEMHDRINKVDEIFQTVKDKIEHSASYLVLIGEGVKKLVEMTSGKKGKKR
jgi:CHASE3 domain sensor protein